MFGTDFKEETGMSRIDGYNIYQQVYEKNVQKKNDLKKAESAAKADKNEKLEKYEPVELSDKAKALLEELKKKYNNMDFMIANYDSEEEASRYLSRGTKEFSVLIEPELLEEMATDDSVKEKYLGLLDDATKQLTTVKEELSDEEEADVKHLGVTIGADGSLKFFAELEKSSAKQRERIEAAKEKKQEEKKEAAEKAEEKAKEKKVENGKVKQTKVSADSIEELIDKIRNVDWESVKPKMVSPTGAKYDFTI